MYLCSVKVSGLSVSEPKSHPPLTHHFLFTFVLTTVGYKKSPSPAEMNFHSFVCSQNALRLVAFRQIHKVLGMEPLPVSKAAARNRKRRRDGSDSGEGEGEGKKDKKEEEEEEEEG